MSACKSLRYVIAGLRAGVAGSDAPSGLRCPPPPKKKILKIESFVMFMTGMGNITRNKMIYAIESIFMD